MDNQFKELLKEKDILEDKDKSEKLKEKEEKIKTQERMLAALTGKLNQLTYPSSVSQREKERDSTQSTISKYTPQQLLNLYLSNQFVYRGVNIRADKLVNVGYRIKGGDEEGVKKCTELMKNSGEDDLIWLLAVNAHVCGDGYLEKCWNKKGTELLRLDPIHPVTFGFKKDRKSNKIIIDPETKKPVSYEQLVVVNGRETYVDVPLDKIGHLVLNRIGDEFNGISTLQPVYQTVVRLMNMEESAAEAAVRTANPLWLGTVATRSPNELMRWGRILGRIGGKNQLLIPEHLELDLLSPGLTNFPEYADYYLNAVVAGLGVPKPLLVGVGETSNRAVSVVQSKQLDELTERNQKPVERLFDRIFEEYGERAGFEAPRLVFNEVTKDISAIGDTVIQLYTSGLITRVEGRNMLGFEESGDGSFVKGEDIEKTLHENDMETWHDGSQKGNKKKIKSEPSYVESPK